ncbi:MAG: GtrA family protein, partial [Oscillospiraceae bacterium]
FGFATFLVDTGIFTVLGTVFDLRDSDVLLHICSVFSTSVAIVFAYVTNRKFVFKSTVHGFQNVAKEMIQFFAARIFTMIMAELLLQYMVGHLNFEPRIMKFLVNVLVIALNYAFSKIWIFRQD